MDIHAMQSMDWLFKKERIYLLAQFWQQRATLAEKEVNALKEQLASAKTIQAKPSGEQVNNKMADCEQQTLDLISRNNIEGELALKDKEISQLVQDIQRLQSSIGKLQESSANQIARLEEQLEQRRQHIVHLEARLDAQSDYEEVKRELSLLRSIELPSGDAGESKTLKMLMVERTKAIQAEKQAIHPASPPHRAETPLPHGEETPVKTEPAAESDKSEIPSPPPPPPQQPPPPPPPPQQQQPPPHKMEEGETTEEGERNETEDDVNHSSPRSHHSPQPVSPNIPTRLSSSTPTLQSPSMRTPTPHDSYLNGKLPDDCHNNNHLTQLINNQNMLTNGLNLNSLNNNIINLNHHNFIRNSEMCMDMKSPFRFDEHRYRFGDDNVMVGRLGESLIPKGDPMEARLQEMLRYNMDKYSTQNLDTLHIARRVRELLSIHNIGQRLFAKYVLGLSQGTVSELLSKPKPWDKLTEKGRDSYRKMHAWACDENAVLLLKSLIPKKAGKEGSLPPFGREVDSQNLTDERIAHILSEASHMMGKNSSAPPHNEDQNSHEEDSKSPMNCPSPMSAKENSLSRRLKKYENDDIPQEKVVRIYQEELAKLIGRGPGGGPHPFPSLLFPHFFGGPPGSMDRSQEDMRLALDAYHRELAKLNTCPSPGLPGLLALQQQAMQQQNPAQQQNGGAQDLSLPKERKSETPGPPSTPGLFQARPSIYSGLAGYHRRTSPGSTDRPGTAQSLKLVNGVAESTENAEKERDREFLLKKEAAMMDPAVAEAIRHAGSAFSLVRPKTEQEWPQPSTGSTASSPLSNSILPPVLNPSDDLVTSSAASPLQRMASITNSLISQPTVQSHHTTNQRPLKAVLPPITQQQFDMFNNLNTEEIVKRVKEQLSQYSISQRLFGESVLGLSQGSVSDLLARPKPWHMLTQKGREPFIRMKMFLEDEQAVHKLVASQYKIAPEKLMRTGGYGGATINPPPLPPKHSMPPTSKHNEQLSNMAANLLQAQQQHQLEQRDREQRERERKNMEREREIMRETILPPSLNIMPPSNNSMLGSPPSLSGLMVGSDLKKGLTSGSMPPQPHQLTNMRALHQHISPSVYEMAALTQDLDTQIITTKIKEALLANNIGQKIFGEAVLGLSQGSVSELLSKPKPWHMLSIKGREPFIRMQLWLSDAHNIDRLQALKNERRELNKRRRSSGHGGDNSSDTSSNDTSEFYHSASPGPGPPSAKKQRVLFSEEQKEALRLAFALDPYPNVATIEFLANELGLSSRTITNWFHNHRMRLKQQVPHPQEPNPNVQRDPQQPFDPVQFRVLLNQRLLEVQKERLGLGSVPLPYPPYFANNNLATLISRGLIPPECENLLANVAKEQFGGLDLSMSGLKREPFDDEDVGSELGSDDSNLSSASLRDVKKEDGDELEEERTATSAGQNRSSRRKPAAPQWVNPEWQEEKKSSENEVIINGVCVMQTDEFSREKEEETIRVEPTAVLDRYEHSDDSSDDHNNEREPDQISENAENEVDKAKETKTSNEGNNWEF